MSVHVCSARLRAAAVIRVTALAPEHLGCEKGLLYCALAHLALAWVCCGTQKRRIAESFLGRS